MEKHILLFILSSLVSFSQSEYKITSKKRIPLKGNHLKLKSIVNDSRCPQNVTCAWAGEVSVVVEVYKDKKLVEEKTIVFNAQNREENRTWFQQYYCDQIELLSRKDCNHDIPSLEHYEMQQNMQNLPSYRLLVEVPMKECLLQKSIDHAIWNPLCAGTFLSYVRYILEIQQSCHVVVM